MPAKSTNTAAKSPPMTISISCRPGRGNQLTKRAGEALLGDLVGMITKHLKK